MLPSADRFFSGELDVGAAPFVTPLLAPALGVPCVEDRKKSGEEDGTLADRCACGVPFACACDDCDRGAGDDILKAQCVAAGIFEMRLNVRRTHRCGGGFFPNRGRVARGDALSALGALCQIGRID